MSIDERRRECQNKQTIIYLLFNMNLFNSDLDRNFLICWSLGGQIALYLRLPCESFSSLIESFPVFVKIAVYHHKPSKHCDDLLKNIILGDKISEEKVQFNRHC